ncbi:hypothetical protein B0H67DRAFT_600072 [Lasiosphaeris hirsuta]|uniref:Uncharacterized protein n=1 Tax=Lasiosphaeris hirsuta TaxID=260670 RepID=A0AA40ARG2_9PEZI|nr:hypothetical protein B0H67DRAFT_600072 [Lasiosphaeris hirsuta]
MLAPCFRVASPLRGSVRGISTLASNKSIKVFPHPQNPKSYLLSYLDTTPPNLALAIGTTTSIPPSPNSFQENHGFLTILNDVLAEHSPKDPGLQSQAQALASPGGFTFTQPRTRRDSGTGAGGASAEGGAGGREPEDIMGSVEVDSRGMIIGNFQPSGTYRIVTNEGILGLSPFLQEKLVARLREEEKKA